mgnify:CR=1 FL=1
MRFKTIKISAILVSLPFLLQAQSEAELKKKYPGEEAVVVRAAEHYEIKLSKGVPVITSKETRQIMYLSDNAVHLGRHRFYHSGFHELGEYEAYTQTPDNRKIRVSQFKTESSTSAGIFYDDTKEKVFDFPSVTTGSVGNLKLSYKHKNPYLLSPHYFSRGIPVVYNELKISFPNEMTIRYLFKGMNTDVIKFSEEKKKNETIYTFYVNDLPAEKSYPDAPSYAWYSPHVVFYIESYRNDKGELVRHLKDSTDLYRLNSSFIRDVKKEAGSELKAITDSLIAGKNSDRDKTQSIFRWVQQHIKYVAFEDGMEGFVPRNADFVCHRRFGDCKDMGNLLTVMLNAAGVKAYNTWIGTRKLPYSYREIPTPIVDNHMICTALIDGEYIFLDATDPDCIFGFPTQGIQGKEALVALSPDSFRIVTVPVVPAEKNTAVDSTYITLTEDGIKGKIALHFTGYYASAMHGYLNNLDERDREQRLKGSFSRGSNKFRLDGYRIGDLSDKNKLSMFADFSLSDYAKKSGDEWFINLNFRKLFQSSEIDIPNRKMPVEYDFHDRVEKVVVLEIPEGYKVGYLPSGKSFWNDVWGFDMNYKEENNRVILTFRYTQRHLLLPVEKFAESNEVLRHLFPLYKETVSLVKK